MTTHLKHTMTYDASLDDVSAMLDDEAFRTDVVAAQGGTVQKIEITVSDGTATALVDQVQPAKGIPSYAQKFVGDRINIVQREEWTAADHADLEVTIPGKPGQMVGSITLTEKGGTTTETVEVDIKVGIPMVGGKIEKLIADMLTKALQAEERTGRAYLSR